MTHFSVYFAGESYEREGAGTVCHEPDSDPHPDTGPVTTGVTPHDCGRAAVSGKTTQLPSTGNLHHALLQPASWNRCHCLFCPLGQFLR